MLEMMLDEESGILRQDVSELFNEIALNPLGNSIALIFLNQRWSNIEDS